MGEQVPPTTEQFFVERRHVPEDRGLYNVLSEGATAEVVRGDKENAGEREPWTVADRRYNSRRADRQLAPTVSPVSTRDTPMGRPG